MKTRTLGLLGALALALPSPARAEDIAGEDIAAEDIAAEDIAAEDIAAEDIAAHPTVAAGFAFPLVGYEAYGIGVDVRLGVDLVFDHDLSQLLALELGWTGLAIPGARVDLVPLTVGWRWVPAPEIGFYTIVLGGTGLAIDTLEAQLGERRFETRTVRVAGFVTVGIGITFLEHIDLEVIYRQAVIAGDAVDPLGTIGARLGGRL